MLGDKSKNKRKKKRDDPLLLISISFAEGEDGGSLDGKRERELIAYKKGWHVTNLKLVNPGAADLALFVSSFAGSEELPVTACAP